MSSTFMIKRHDTLPALTVKLQSTSGEALDIELAGTTVQFIMKDINTSNVIISDACTIIDGPTATVQYDWKATDTEISGEYLGEFEVTYSPSGKKITVPTDDSLFIVIIDDYNNS